MVSDELRRQADGFLEVVDLVPEIRRLQLSDPEMTTDGDEATGGR
jgi:hypothetical protein